MKELVEYIAKALVDEPDDVRVDVIESNQTIIVELRVAKKDLGKIIGKQGRNVSAVRTILSAASAKHQKKSVLEIIE